jgi:hypothetical protein
MLGIYRVATQVVASRVVLDSTELVTYLIFEERRLLGCDAVWLVTGVSLLFYTQTTFVLHRKHIYVPPQLATGMALLSPFFYSYTIFKGTVSGIRIP